MDRHGYCEPHKSEINTYWRDTDRPNAYRRGYDKRWKVLRDGYLRSHPLCSHCEAKGRIVPARLVDHIKPLADGGDRLDELNLQSLCVECHYRKTAGDQKRNAVKPEKVGVRG